MATVRLETPAMISGNTPLIGHAAQFFRDPVSLLRKGYAEQGRIFGLRLGNRKGVVILGPENNKFFFKETDKLLSIREGYPFFHKMFNKDFYFFAEFDEYMKQRQIMIPRFKGPNMRGYVSLMAEETLQLMDKMGDEGEIDLIPTLGPLVMDIAAHAFLGKDFCGRLGKQFFKDFRDFSGGMEVILPLWLPIPRLRRSKQAKKKLHRILRDWIHERRANPMEPADFFQELVEAKEEDGQPISEELVVNLILLMVWAGHETTAGHISWALIDLLQHPEYLDGVRKQTLEVLGNNSGKDMTWQDARDLALMELAVKETERLHPVAFVMMRKASEDIELDGHKIEKGSMVFAAPCVSHIMPDVFPHPHAYNPKRFTTGMTEIGPEANSLIGFGGGLHRCAGVNFARLEMKIVLTMLVKRYELELIDAPKPISGASTYWPQSPCRVRYKLRVEDEMDQETLEALRKGREDSEDAVEAERCPFQQN